MTEEQLRTLLQQRATEKPPEGYCEELLQNLHRRQRSELLHRSLWQIAYERISTFWGEHSVSAPVYTLSLAALTLLGLLSIFSFKTTPLPSATTARQDIKQDLPPAAIQDVETSREHQKRPVEAQPVRFDQR